MRVNKVEQLINLAARISAKVTNNIAAACLFFLMVFTCADIALRYFFNKPIDGSYELTEFLMAIIVSFSLANGALHHVHVKVDLLTSKLSFKGQIIMNCIADIAFFGLFALITWRIIPRAIEMTEYNQVSLILRIPVYPFVLIVAVGTGVLCIVLLKNFFDELHKAGKN